MPTVPATARGKGAVVRPMVERFSGACGEAALRDVVAALTPDVLYEAAHDSGDVSATVNGASMRGRATSGGRSTPTRGAASSVPRA